MILINAGIVAGMLLNLMRPDLSRRLNFLVAIKLVLLLVAYF